MLLLVTASIPWQQIPQRLINEKSIPKTHMDIHSHSVPSPGQLMTQNNVMQRACFGWMCKLSTESHSVSGRTYLLLVDTDASLIG